MYWNSRNKLRINIEKGYPKKNMNWDLLSGTIKCALEYHAIKYLS